MAKQRNRAVDYAAYVGVRLFAALIRALPFRIAARAAEGVSLLAMKVLRRRNEIARDNLRHAFPGEYNDAQIERLLADMYRHFFRMMVEIVHFDHLFHLRNWRKLVEFSTAAQYERFADVVFTARPIMMVTAHFGNWEVLSYVLGRLGFPGHVIARKLDNPYVDRWLRRWRESTGQKLVAKNGEFDLIEGALLSGGILGTVGDQDAGARGLFVPFFNRPASTHKAIALLALRHEPLMVVGAVVRIGWGLKFRAYLEDVIDPIDYRGRSDAINAISVRFTSALERMIRRHPEQYFWLHRRWKHQPSIAKNKAA
jgi:Kdo2-lipid IVA lauroyltransferase/acyltransferase